MVKINNFLSSIEVASDQLLLFRGQRKLTEDCRSIHDRKFGTQQAIERLQRLAEDQSAIWEIERDQSSGTGRRWREYIELLRYEKLGTSLRAAYRNKGSWDNSPFVSTTDSLNVAIGNFAFGNGGRVRYLYFLRVPANLAIPIDNIIMSISSRRANFSYEREFSIPIDATSYVVGVYDLEKSRFLSWKPNDF